MTIAPDRITEAQDDTDLAETTPLVDVDKLHIFAHRARIALLEDVLTLLRDSGRIDTASMELHQLHSLADELIVAYAADAITGAQKSVFPHLSQLYHEHRTRKSTEGLG